MSNVLSKNVVRTKYMATDLQYQYFLTSFNHHTSVSMPFIPRCTTHNIQPSQLHRLYDQVLFPYTRPMIFQTCRNMDYIICTHLYAMVQRIISGVSTLPFQDVMGSCAMATTIIRLDKFSLMKVLIIHGSLRFLSDDCQIMMQIYHYF